PAGLTINATSGDINVTTSTPGTYTVTYTMAATGGCPVQTATTSVTINAPSVAPTGATATQTSLCGPGSVTLSVTGGTLGSGTWRWYSGSCGGTLVGTGATLNVTVNSTTTYFVRAEGPCNTTACASVTVTVNTVPTVSIVTSATTIKPGQPAILTATVSPSGTPVQWYKGAVAVPGVTGTTLTAGVTDYGTYTARATTGAGCTALSNAVTITAEATSTVFVYPNPSAGRFQVRVYNAPGKLLYVQVYNSFKQRVYQQKHPTSAPYTRMDVDLRNAASGNYVVKVVDSDGTVIGADHLIIVR
ncbi:MAG: T9SS type A sorting domain-containing protein, partial [Ferruginibacter sp.]|nr:T9SS type A sorting domain-containing protein [Ferruginibacter sp.]